MIIDFNDKVEDDADTTSSQTDDDPASTAASAASAGTMALVAAGGSKKPEGSSQENGGCDATLASNSATPQVFAWMHGSRQVQKKNSSGSTGTEESKNVFD